MEDLINEEILENIHEGYEIYQMIIELEGNIYPQIRYVIRDQNENLIRHNGKEKKST